MTLTFDLSIKIIFSPWIWVWQNVFALWHRHMKFWHMGVSPWDNILDLSMTLTFDLYAGSGGILNEFYSQFLSCSNRNRGLWIYNYLFINKLTGNGIRTTFLPCRIKCKSCRICNLVTNLVFFLHLQDCCFDEWQKAPFFNLALLCNLSFTMLKYCKV